MATRYFEGKGSLRVRPSMLSALGRDGPSVLLSSVGEGVAKDALECLEAVPHADLLAFTISPAVLRHGELVDPARLRG